MDLPPPKPPLNPPGAQPPRPPPGLPIVPITSQATPALPIGPPPLLPYGDVLPPRAPPALAPLDARTYALSALLDYVATIPFVRVATVGKPPRAMPIARDDMHTSMPSSDLVMPSLVCLSGPIEKIPCGMSPQPDESTLHAYGYNTVLVPQHEHVETVPIEIWASKADEAKSVLAGLEASFSPMEGVAGMRLILPTYYGRVARFLYDRDEHPQDDSMAVKNRWRVIAHVVMQVSVVRLYNAVTMLPIVTVDTETFAASPLSAVPQPSYGNKNRNPSST